MLCTDYQLHDQSNGLHSDIDHASVDLNDHKLPARDIEIYGLSEHAILPSSLTDFMAETVCDIIPIVKPATNTSPLPELVYFINKLCVRSHINWHVAIIALIYLHRCKRVLPKGAVGNPDTAHRIFLASVLTASKFLHDTTAATAPRLTNQKLCDLCDGMYTLRDIGDLERAFLKVIKYRCWVSHDDIQRFLSKHRADMLL